MLSTQRGVTLELCLDISSRCIDLRWRGPCLAVHKDSLSDDQSFELATSLCGRCTRVLGLGWGTYSAGGSSGPAHKPIDDSTGDHH